MFSEGLVDVKKMEIRGRFYGFIETITSHPSSRTLSHSPASTSDRNTRYYGASNVSLSRPVRIAQETHALTENVRGACGAPFGRADHCCETS